MESGGGDGREWCAALRADGGECRTDLEGLQVLVVEDQADVRDFIRSLQPEDMDCSYVRQPRSLGLGHAVLCAQSLVGCEPFAVLLADDLMTGPDGGDKATA